jgi:hypothetical protein
MRRALAAGLVLAALPAAGFAQPGPYLAVVSDSEVKLRAGPSDQFPETGTLPKGARVVVEGEESGGWVAVTAPQGQVSWVPYTFVDFDPSRPVPQDVVVQDEVTLATGRVGLPQPLQQIRRAKVPAGTILTVIGGTVQHDGKKWYPVAPPHGDVRYVPKNALQPEKALATAFTVRTNDTVSPAGAGTGPPAAIPGPGAVSAPASPPKPVVNHPLWAQAEAAERAGKYDDAEKVYFQLARAMNEPGGDHDVANLCYTRIHALREKKRAGGTATAAIPPAARPVSRDGERSTLLPPVKEDRTGSRPAAGPPPASDPNDARPRWTGAGLLTRSALAIDGRRTYALESAHGVVRLYVVPAQGVDLERYLNRRVDVFGSTYARRDLSKPYVVAAQVELNP